MQVIKPRNTIYRKLICFLKQKHVPRLIMDNSIAYKVCVCCGKIISSTQYTKH